MQYFSLLKRKEILSHATTQADILLSQISQSQKDKYFFEVLRVVKIRERESRMGVTRG
jgi:hypothetical protein